MTDPDCDVTDDQIVQIGAALRNTEIRDAIWIASDQSDPENSGTGALWLHVARRLPSPYDAAPLFLHAWIAWRRGDGARANIATEHALASDPNYSAARLLAAALHHGIDPRRFAALTAEPTSPASN